MSRTLDVRELPVVRQTKIIGKYGLCVDPEVKKTVCCQMMSRAKPDLPVDVRPLFDITYDPQNQLDVEVGEGTAKLPEGMAEAVGSRLSETRLNAALAATCGG